MTKKIAILCIILALLSCTACKKQPKTIELSFDKDTAYFTGSVPLYPIAGAVLSDEDVFESATVKLSAALPAVMRLSVAFDEGALAIEGLTVSVNGGAGVAFGDGIELYKSANAETAAEVLLKIYLKSGTPESVKGKELSFIFVLEYEA